MTDSMYDDMIYSNVTQYRNKIAVIGYRNGKRFTAEIPFKPTVFFADQNGEFRNLKGSRFSPVKTKSISDYREFRKKYTGVSGNLIANCDIPPVTQFLHSQFGYDLADSGNHIRVAYIDIETRVDHGFSSPSVAINEINAITLYSNGAYHVFAMPDYREQSIDIGHTQIDEVVIYHHSCSTERDLLISFIQYWSKNYPDIVSGWNCNGFDFPYLMKRIKTVLGETACKRMSPWGNFLRFDKPVEGFNSAVEERIILDGISILDYMELYKKFILEPRESYQLDSIADVELGKGKLKSGYSTFDEFYTKDYQKFIEYNIIDVSLLVDLDEKLKLIDLAKTIAYYGKCNFTDVFSPVRVWESLIYGIALNQKIVLDEKDTGDGGMFEGAYVKTIKPGLYNWVVSFDATSLYPHIVMGWNMSPETKMNKVLPPLVPGLNETVGGEGFCVAANGTVYSTEKPGMMPELMEMLFRQRKEAKDKAQELKRNNPDDPAIAHWDYKQKAIKILANSGYGVMSNRFFRFFDLDIAEAITATGRFIIQSTEAHLNAFFQKQYQFSDETVVMADTDSVYLELARVIPQNIMNDREKVVNFLKGFASEVVEAEINTLMETISAKTGTTKNRIHFKREAVAETVVTTAKKRYGMKLWSMEDVDYSEPKIKVIGLELIRSTTPKYVRKLLDGALKFILDKDEKGLQSYVLDASKEFKEQPVEFIAFPKSVNGIIKYKSEDPNQIFRKGTPIHTKGCILFNHLVDELNLDRKYKKIHDGEKIRFVYLTVPNPKRLPVMGFRDSIPEEFELDNWIDYDKMLDKTFTQPLQALCNAVGMDIEPKNTLDNFFV